MAMLISSNSFVDETNKRSLYVGCTRRDFSFKLSVFSTPSIAIASEVQVSAATINYIIFMSLNDLTLRKKEKFQTR
jgi:hypothetical protein